MINEGKNKKQPAIIFDLGGVLLDWNPRYLFRKMFNGDEAEMEHFLKTVCTSEWNHQQDKGYPIAQAIEERVQLFPEYSIYIHAYYERWEEAVKGEISATVEILSQLRDRDYPLFALSNWPRETFAQLRHKHEFLNWFDQIIVSGEVKMSKPDREIFELLLDRIQREPDECLFIDDREINIDAADRLGFQTILYESPQKLSEYLLNRGLL